MATGVTTDTAPETRANFGRSNRLTHIWSLSATKLADGLIEPKLVLTWLLTAVGAPGCMLGALVPIREAGALLPQLALTRWVQTRAYRRWIWALGSVEQGAAALTIATAVLFLDGAAAGWAVLAALTVLAVARSSCSASYKDVLARTVEKTRRGTVTGTSGSIAAGLVLVFAVLVSVRLIPLTVPAIAAAVALAAGLWLFAAANFLRLYEPRARNTDPPDLSDLTGPFRNDSEFRSYIATRALLIPTALAPPFVVMLSQTRSDSGLGDLGVFLIAASSAAILSSYIWGRLSDRSGRLTLAAAAASASVTLAATAAVGLATGGLGPVWLAGLCSFAAQIAYQGVRAGRSTHLTDMDTHGRKPVYTALSNTTIGLLLAAGGGFGLLADATGPAVVLATFAALCALAVVPALRLSEVQQD